MHGGGSPGEGERVTLRLTSFPDVVVQSQERGRLDLAACLAQPSPSSLLLRSAQGTTLFLNLVQLSSTADIQCLDRCS